MLILHILDCIQQDMNSITGIHVLLLIGIFSFILCVLIVFVLIFPKQK